MKAASNNQSAAVAIIKETVRFELENLRQETAPAGKEDGRRACVAVFSTIKGNLAVRQSLNRGELDMVKMALRQHGIPSVPELLKAVA